MSHFQGELRCILMFGEVIRSEGMPKAVIWPSRETDGAPERLNVGVIISSLGQVNRPGHLGVRTQPFGEILRDRIGGGDRYKN
jgi:hypothetical protein